MSCIKCVVAGDGAVGKTCLIVTYATNLFPNEYQPTVSDAKHIKQIHHNDLPLVLQLWDTACVDEADELKKQKPESYDSADFFIICFSLDRPDSYESVRSKWHARAKRHCPRAPIILVGTKLDLRDINFNEANLCAKQIAKPTKGRVISLEQGEKMQKAIGAVMYLECSALTGKGLADLFEAVIKITEDSSKVQTRRQGSSHYIPSGLKGIGRRTKSKTKSESNATAGITQQGNEPIAGAVVNPKTLRPGDTQIDVKDTSRNSAEYTYDDIKDTSYTAEYTYDVVEDKHVRLLAGDDYTYMHGASHGGYVDANQCRFGQVKPEVQGSRSLSAVSTEGSPPIDSRRRVLSDVEGSSLNSRASHIPKVVLVGNEAVGKSCMLLSHQNKRYDCSVYSPTEKEDCISTLLIFDSELINVGFWDLSGASAFDSMRSQHYNQTDLFIICFSIISQISFDSVLTRWHPEVRRHCPDTPILLVGLKLDLRNDPRTIEVLRSKEANRTPITEEQGRQMAMRINAMKYIECSARTQEGLSNVFEEVAKLCYHKHTRSASGSALETSELYSKIRSQTKSQSQRDIPLKPQSEVKRDLQFTQDAKQSAENIVGQSVKVSAEYRVANTGSVLRQGQSERHVSLALSQESDEVGQQPFPADVQLRDDSFKSSQDASTSGQRNLPQMLFPHPIPRPRQSATRRQISNFDSDIVASQAPRSCRSSSLTEMGYKHVFVVGDVAVGKTCMLISYAEGRFPSNHVAMKNDCFSIRCFIHDQWMSLILRDIGGAEQINLSKFDRPDVLLLCFSVISPSSYESVRTKWYPMVRRLYPNSPIVLVGTKLDLRNNPEEIEKLTDINSDPITWVHGKWLMDEIHAEEYLECSARTGEGLTDVFNAVLRKITLTQTEPFSSHSLASSQLNPFSLSLSESPELLRSESSAAVCSNLNAEEVYKVTFPQGFCLILNVCAYEAHSGYPDRHGSERDAAMLNSLFKDLRFQVVALDNPSCSEISDALSKVTLSSELSNHGCFVCFLMAHGDNESVYGSDGEPLRIQSIIERFSASQCKKLSHKPKLFVIQACRGKKLDGDRSSLLVADTNADFHCPKDSDILICYPNTAGHQAYRDEQLGSPFIQTLCQVIEERHKSEHILDMITRANRCLKTKPLKLGPQSVFTVPEMVSRLSKKWFLDPDLADV